MNAVVLPYGREGWIERTRLVERMFAGPPHPPFLYNDILVLVPASRMRRAYGRLFLEIFERLHGSKALVPPEVLTLHQFFSRLYAALGGPPIIDENSRLVMLEGIVKELITGKRAFGKNPDILAPSLSAAVADMLEQLTAAGITAQRLTAVVAESDFSHKPQVRLLVEAFDRYERLLADTSLQDPAGMVAALAERFDPAWLAPYTRIVIDGIHEANDAQAKLLGKITGREHCAFLIEAPSPESIDRAGEHHPLRLIKDFLKGLGMSPGPGETPLPAEDRVLSDALFSNEPFNASEERARKLPSFDRDICLLSAINMREEVSLIAAEVKKSLHRGVAPDSILVSFPSLDDYGPLVEEIFIDYGIPYNRALGRQLSASPVTAALLSLLRAHQEEYSGPSLLRIFSSPFMKFGEHPFLAPALDRVLRKQRITGGKNRLLAALRHQTAADAGNEALAAATDDLFAALASFTANDAEPLAAWMEKLSALMTWSGINARVRTIAGPLNINLQAYRKLNETLASLSRAGGTFPAYRYTFSEWLFLLRKTFMHTRFQVPPEDEGGVQILGLGESAGHGWTEIHLGGLIDGKFPLRPPQNIFLPEATLEALGVRTLEQARMNATHHFHRLLLSAPTVMLTWPESEGDRPVAPSPFLKELTPLANAGLLNRGREKTSGLQFSLRIEESRSIPELAKAVAVAGEPGDLSTLLQGNSAGLRGILAALRHEPEVSAAATMALEKRVFSVTELDAYIRCPYDYYVAKVLGIEPLEDVTEDLSAAGRGSAVHGILRNFYLSWNGPVTRELRDDARALLAKLGNAAFDREADTFRNRRERGLFLSVMAERFLDAEEDFWNQGMQPAYLEQKIEHFLLPLSNGEEVELSAKIDRIDVDDNGNFLVVDYKTGRYPLPKMNIDQDIFQLPLYAVMAGALLRRGKPALNKAIGLAYYDLAGKSGAGARDVALYDRDARADHPSSKPKASPKSAGEFEAILSRSLDKARGAVEGILAGDFTSRPQDENQCRYCPNGMMCESEVCGVS